MRGDAPVGQTIVEVAREPLRGAPALREHQRRAVRLDELGNLLQRRIPDRVARRRKEVVDGSHHLKIEIAGETGTYIVPPHRNDYAGVVLTLARQETPDMSSYTDAEIVVTIRKDYHAGLIVASPDPQRVDALIADYTQRFYSDFFATAPPPERPVE